MSDVTVKTENDSEDRKDPTCFLPEEPMCYEIKKKKKKKKKQQEDPFKDIEDKTTSSQTEMITSLETDVSSYLDPEVNIKVEDIEVELDFNDFHDNSGLEQDADFEDPNIKVKEEENKEAVLLTFESVIKENLYNNLLNDDTPLPPKNEQDDEDIPYQPLPTKVQVCKICHLVFQSLKTLKIHQKRKHKVFRKFFKHICDDCGMSYEKKNSLIAHIRRKHGPDAEPEDSVERTCEICSMVFKGMNRLRLHMTRKHGSFQEAFKHVCKICGLTYDKYRSLIVHFRRKHSNRQKSKMELSQWFKCPICQMTFLRRETYARHVQRKHKVDEDGVKKDDAMETKKNLKTGEFSCPKCPLMFSSANYIKLHMRRQHNALGEDFRFKCKICNLSYAKMESLKTHVRRKHEQKSYCFVCNKQFDSNDAYLNHTHVKVPRECTICGMIFASQGGLAKHVRCTHKVDAQTTVYCNICNAGFFNKRQLKPHYMKVHLQASYKCNSCTKVFKARESFKRHVLKCHPLKQLSDTEVHKCEQCTESFKDEFELCKHINFTHGETATKNEIVVKKEDTDLEIIKNSYQCTKCPDTYNSWEELKLHYEQNHVVSESTQCQVCGEMVPGSELQKHMKEQHTERENTCKYCEFKTTSRCSLTQHMLRHKNAATLKCDYPNCKYKTFYEDAMLKHKRKHADIGENLQCSQCPFQCMNKYILKYHEDAHRTGKKRYACDQCDYATILPANLIQHKYKHSTEKRFKCDVCPFATKYNTSLRFHVRKKHCDLPSFS